MLSPADFRIGRVATVDTSALRASIDRMMVQKDEVAKTIQVMEQAIASLSGSPLTMPESDDETVHAARADIERRRQLLGALDTRTADRLRDELAALEGKKAEISKWRDESIDAIGRARGAIETNGQALEALELAVPDAKEADAVAQRDPDFDGVIYDEEKAEVERTLIGYPEQMAAIKRKVDPAKTRVDTAATAGRDALLDYIRDGQADVQADAMDWREAHQWVGSEILRLTDTMLVPREQEAESVRLASEETFRKDIAISLSDRFSELAAETRDRNRMLELCPPFTGGERYQFQYAVVPQHRALYNYIRRVAQNDEEMESLFAEEHDEAQLAITQLIEAAADPDGNERAPIALLDYREFFSFDLDILVDGKVVDRMSKRQGAGSNGEHIAPMYVAAGASLAKAYRLPAHSEDRSCSGLMLLDEAFHGMDTQNAMATARFLDGIGLQLIMAGPELERTKLIPMTDTIYDLDREELDLQMQRTYFKPAAHQLMTSDMPSENPAVMVEALREIQRGISAEPG
jgi:hypothetical protein